MAVKLHPVGFRVRFVAIARAEIGVREVGNNGGKRVREYQSDTWLAPASWPWCAAFVSWCYQRTADAMFPGARAIAPRTPRAFEFEKWGQDHGLEIRKPADAIAGDIIVFDFSHVGIASGKPAPGGLPCIEGNTSAAGLARDGEGVFIRHRSLSLVRSVLRICESSTPQTF